MAGTNWRAVVLAYAIGVIGAVQVGRLAPATEDLREGLSMNLASLGWAISTITLPSALLGVAAGIWVGRRGARSALLLGAGLLALAALAASAAPNAPLLTLLRGIEGIGYLAIVVAAPTLMADEARGRDQQTALALWGTFFTFGLSLAAMAGGTLSVAWGWRGWFAANALLVAGAALIALRALPRGPVPATITPGPVPQRGRLGAAAWLLGAAFLGMTLVTLALMSMMPSFLIEMRGFTQAEAGRATGLVALAAIAGSLSYGLIGSRIRPGLLIGLAGALLLLCALPAFDPRLGLGAAMAAAVIAVYGSGVLTGFTFAAVPRLAPSPAEVGPTNGLIAQLASIGAFLGPPLIGGLVTRYGWQALSLAIIGFTLSFLILGWAALRAAQR
ncbi:MFS transporter [Pararhodobacter sp.]|uniref:MFS transporter n=1 Tax=Pararhodobacter sp. TaxID=2127056 RepID=UPI002AFF7550|nr:MFS transporter [Pararhodobacter sp.]